MSIRRYRERPLTEVQREKAEQQLPLNMLGKELTTLKLMLMKREARIQSLEQELAAVKHELLQIKGGEGA
ncbi:hypothetical protein ACAF76_002540 [Brevibacillus sp. TJ4]|uniref:hypothetical protein n=1 Tax=Brevibacillus sp. TJ4 TaxID=3234853 RepID=UPI0037D3C9C2